MSEDPLILGPLLSTQMMEQRPDLTKPRWDQATFVGRLKYFFAVTDPRLSLLGDSELEGAKSLLELYKQKQEPEGTTPEQLWRAKHIYESAFHPDTGEKQNVFGRMSFQVPGGMLITGAMLQWYKSNAGVIFWQWVNQSFNALVNYTNRNANVEQDNSKLVIAYVSATSSALVTALGLKAYLAKKASPLFQRYVPFAAVAAANMVNIPLMRRNEIENGILCVDDEGSPMMNSKTAAILGISQVTLSRIVMAMPGMTVLPVIMERLEKKAWMQRVKPLHGPIQVVLVGCFLLFMTPTACSLFPQTASINTSTIEKFETLPEKPMPDVLRFNKGL